MQSNVLVFTSQSMFVLQVVSCMPKCVIEGVEGGTDTFEGNKSNLYVHVCVFFAGKKKNLNVLKIQIYQIFPV